jgi:hypothetical protein
MNVPWQPLFERVRNIENKNDNCNDLEERFMSLFMGFNQKSASFFTKKVKTYNTYPLNYMVKLERVMKPT